MVKYVFLSIYKQDIDVKELENNRNNLFTRVILPFAYTTELSRLANFKGNILIAIIGFILLLPLPLLYILPFYLEYYMLHDVHTRFYTDTLGKISFWISLWLCAVTIFYFILLSVNNFLDMRDENTIIENEIRQNQ
jgi:hypothetical protein